MIEVENDPKSAKLWNLSPSDLAEIQERVDGMKLSRNPGFRPSLSSVTLYAVYCMLPTFLTAALDFRLRFDQD
jgi:hypothetical protein